MRRKKHGGQMFAPSRFMKQILTRRNGCLRGLTAVLCAIAISPGSALANNSSTSLLMAQTPTAAADDARLPPDQLDSLVAPIALYPDPLLAQVLAASTYPLEIMQLQQWLERNPGLKDKALADAVAKQSWDPSVQAMAALPDVVKWLANDVQWTTDLGNAFLAQQSDVMSAVQRMRRKAEDKGTLKSNEQQVVRTETVQEKSVIVIEQSSPDVVYVPAYDSAAVYGAPVYPYPAVAYPPWGYYAAGAAISFGVGVAMGAAWGGGWGWGAGWGGNNININNNNFYNRNFNNVNRGNINARGGTWQHNPAHRGGTPYSNRATANRFGGTARGDSLANRQAGARQQIGRQGGNLRSNGVGTGGVGRPGGVGGVGGIGGAGRPGGVGGVGGAGRPGGVGGPGGIGGPGGVGNRGGVGTGGVGDRGNIGNRGGVGDRGFSGNRPSGGGIGGADRFGGGQRDLSRSGGSQGAFGGGSGGFNGGAARRDSSRGSSSFGSRGGGSRGGGFSRGGGGGGFSRGGGGGARRGGGGGRRR